MLTLSASELEKLRADRISGKQSLRALANSYGIVITCCNAGSSHRRSLDVTIAALFVDTEGLLRYDFLPALTGVWCLFSRTEEYVLSLLADLRTLGYIQRTEWQDAPFRLVNEEDATASVKEEAQHKIWFAGRAA